MATLSVMYKRIAFNALTPFPFRLFSTQAHGIQCINSHNGKGSSKWTSIKEYFISKNIHPYPIKEAGASYTLTFLKHGANWYKKIIPWSLKIKHAQHSEEYTEKINPSLWNVASALSKVI